MKELSCVPWPAAVFTFSGRASPSSVGAKSAGTFAPHPAFLDARNALARGMLALTTCPQEPRVGASLRSSGEEMCCDLRGLVIHLTDQRKQRSQEPYLLHAVCSWVDYWASLTLDL